MGQYKIQLKPEAVDSIPAVMTSIGLPVTRVEERHPLTFYFYKDPERQKEFHFFTYPRSSGLFWRCGVSPSNKKIAEGFLAAGLFVDETAA